MVDVIKPRVCSLVIRGGGESRKIAVVDVITPRVCSSCSFKKRSFLFIYFSQSSISMPPLPR